MQALPPPLPAPPPIQKQRVRNADDTAGLISIAGLEKQISSFAAIFGRFDKWKQEGQATGTGKLRLLVRRAPRLVPFSEIGGLIYEAQRLGLAITFIPSAPLCEDRKQ